MKTFALILTLSFSIFAGAVFAQEPGEFSEPQGEFKPFDEPPMGDQQQERGPQRGKGPGKGADMAQDNTKLVATSDGGVVVLQGPKLTKYDAAMNWVGEAELRPAGPKPGSKRAQEAPSGPAPMSDAEVAAVLGQVVPEA